MRLELEADPEEEKYHAEFRECGDRLGLLDETESPRTDRDPREEITRDRAEAQAMRGHHGEHGRCEINRHLREKCVAVLHARSIVVRKVKKRAVAGRDSWDSWGVSKPGSCKGSRLSSCAVRSSSALPCAIVPGFPIISIRRKSKASSSSSRSPSRRAWARRNTTRSTTPSPPRSPARCLPGPRRRTCCAARPSSATCTKHTLYRRHVRQTRHMGTPLA